MFLVRTYSKKKRGKKECREKKKIGTVVVYTATVAQNKTNGVRISKTIGTLVTNTLTITHTNKKKR